MERDALTQDNEPMAFTRIGLAAERVVTRLAEQKVEGRDAEPATRDGDRDREAERSDYVQRRLSDLREFERRAKGIQKLR